MRPIPPLVSCELQYVCVNARGVCQSVWMHVYVCTQVLHKQLQTFQHLLSQLASALMFPVQLLLTPIPLFKIAYEQPT